MEGVKSIPNPREIAMAKSHHNRVLYEYQRPPFLTLNQKDLDEARDHGQRKILQPAILDQLPWGAGYAETINSGKSMFKSEDQASVFVDRLDIGEKQDPVHYVLFGVFDGHAGADAALWAANILHNHVRANLQPIKQYLAQEETDVITENDPGLGYVTDPIPKDDLVVGALEKSFIDMDEQIRTESQAHRIEGGCTAMTALFLQNKMFIANAGDCRAVIFKNEFTECVPMSMDFTPETDRIRLQSLAYLQPQLLSKYYGRLEFQRRLRKKDLKTKVLCRDRYSEGWVFHTVEDEDIARVPMISGHGKRARLLSTIGTTRGFGDHFLEAPGNVFVKPFLTPVPQVRICDLKEEKFQPTDILIMATDGLWESLSNEDALSIAKETSQKFLTAGDTLYQTVAHELVLAARGNFGPRGWRGRDQQIASGDDITCFVIPLHKYTSVPAAEANGELDPVLYSAPLPTPSANDETQ